jgi:hypothetical protein
MAAADTSIATELGVSAELVEDIRRNRLTEGEHWTRAEGNRVVFTESGLAALRDALDLGKEPPAKKEGPPPEYLCEVVRVPPAPTFVRVRVSDGSLYDVRVRDNRTLRPRLRIRCRLLTDGRWECCQPGIGFTLPPLPKKEGAAPPPP